MKGLYIICTAFSSILSPQATLRMGVITVVIVSTSNDVFIEENSSRRYTEPYWIPRGNFASKGVSWVCICFMTQRAEKSLQYPAPSLRVVTACPVVLQPTRRSVCTIYKNPSASRTSVVSESLSGHFSFQAETPRANSPYLPFLPSSVCVGGAEGAPHSISSRESQHHRESGMSEAQHWLHSFPQSKDASDHRGRVLQSWAQTSGLLLLCPMLCPQILVGPSLVPLRI